MLKYSIWKQIKVKLKQWQKHISCDCKCKFNSTIYNSNHKWNNKVCQPECENYRKCKIDYSCNPSTCISENIKYLKSIGDASVTGCDEIIIVMDNVSTKLIKGTNDTSTPSMICHIMKVTDCNTFCIQFH